MPSIYIAATSSAAQASPGGSFSYVHVVRNTDPLSHSWNAVKVRTVSSASLRIPPQGRAQSSYPFAARDDADAESRR